MGNTQNSCAIPAMIRNITVGEIPLLIALAEYTKCNIPATPVVAAAAV
jgi:hypothetical protein